jgi:hypothetical protein
MNDTSRNYRSIRQHSNHNGRTGPYLGPFNKTIKSNPYRNINARGQIPLVLLSSGETPPRMGPQSRRAAERGPTTSRFILERRGRRAADLRIMIKQAGPQSLEQSRRVLEPRTLGLGQPTRQQVRALGPLKQN